MKVMTTMTHEVSAPHLVVVEGAVHGFPSDGGSFPASFHHARAVLVSVPWPLVLERFWHETLAPFGERLVLVAGMDDLRAHADVHVSPLASWQRTSREVAAALRSAPELAPLAVCGHVIIAFDRHNALWYRPARGTGPERAVLHYEPRTREGGAEAARDDGVTGLTTALATYLSHALQPEHRHMMRMHHKTMAQLGPWSGLAEAIALCLARRPASQPRALPLSSPHARSSASSRSER